MESPEHDPWNTPEVHKGHNHVDAHASSPAPRANGNNDSAGPEVNGRRYDVDEHQQPPDLHSRTTSNFTTSTIASAAGSASQSAASASNPGGGWGYFDGNSNHNTNNNNNNNNAGGFGDMSSNQPTSPFGVGGGPGGRDPGANPPSGHSRTISGGRTGSAIEENIVVTLMPEKEGMFMFQHHNYEVTSARRGSKVIRRYSDFVWLLDCLHKRYPFRALPLLPPKRVAVNGNHLSNDGAFIEKRRRGLARFLNGVVRHPVLGQEQLVVMFLTVPTVSRFYITRNPHLPANRP